MWFMAVLAVHCAWNLTLSLCRGSSDVLHWLCLLHRASKHSPLLQDLASQPMHQYVGPCTCLAGRNHCAEASLMCLMPALAVHRACSRIVCAGHAGCRWHKLAEGLTSP